MSERVFKIRLLPYMPKGKKWAIMEKIFTEKYKSEWEIIAKYIKSEQKAYEIIEIYKQ